MVLEKDLFTLTNQQILEATEQEYRQYFCGNLKKPQLLDFILTERLEIGISNYKNFTADTPHYHSTTPDMIYLLSGEFHIWIPSKQKNIILHQGDFISVPPQTPYASKAKAGTKVLFIKYCNGNDKVTITPSKEMTDWLAITI